MSFCFVEIVAILSDRISDSVTLKFLISKLYLFLFPSFPLVWEKCDISMERERERERERKKKKATKIGTKLRRRREGRIRS